MGARLGGRTATRHSKKGSERLGGRFGYFYFFLLGEGEGEAPGGGGGGRFLLKFPGGGGFSGEGGAEGRGRCLRRIGEFGGGGAKIFFHGRNVHQGGFGKGSGKGS